MSADQIFAEVEGIRETPEPEVDKKTRERPSSVYGWIDWWANLAIKVSVIFGLFFSGFQYWKSVEREKIQRSFELVDLWQTDRIQKSFTVLKARLQEQQNEALRLMPNMTPQQAETAQKVIGAKIVSMTDTDPTVDEALSTMVYFLNRVANCANTNLCQVSVLDDFFFDYSKQFFLTFGSEIMSGSKMDARPIDKYINYRDN